MTGPDWSKITEVEHEQALRIAKRFEREIGKPPGYQRLNLIMDIEAAHLTLPLDLGRLLSADLATFGHDVGGISRYMDRKTGELGGCFVPRTARRPEPAIQHPPATE